MPLLQRPRWEVVVCLQITLNELSLITCRKCACRPIGTSVSLSPGTSSVRGLRPPLFPPPSFFLSPARRL